MPLKDQLTQWKTKLENINRQHSLLPFGQGRPPSSQQTQQGQYQYQQQQQQQQQSTPYPPYPQQQQQQYYPGQQPGYVSTPPQQYPGSQNIYTPPPSQQQQPQQGYNRPPPIPQHTHPSTQAAYQAPQPVSQRYWTARFDPSTPVSTEWDQKEGNNNGWGNAELENYTRNAENSFYTGDNKLILRAITHNGNHTSARLVSRQTLSRRQGCLTTFLTLPCAPGIWPAFWLLPREPFTWPHEGEVDIAESWNGDGVNHSCLHWGFYTPEDHWKHLTKDTHIADMAHRPVRFDFVWHESGRLIWYIDNKAVMKANLPQGTRNLDDFCVVMNVAMGGNVCAGRVPQNGAYDMVVHTVYMSSEPEIGGWGRFDADWSSCAQGKTM